MDMKKVFLICFFCLTYMLSFAEAYNLVIDCEPSFAGNVSNFSLCEEGSSLCLTATGKSGFKFKCWKENETVLSTQPVFEYTMPGHDVHLIAVFEYAPDNPGDPQVLHRLILNASPSFGGTFNRETISYAQEDTEVSICAYPKNGFKFIQWLENDVPISNDNPLIFNIGKNNHNLKAVFAYTPDNPENPGKMYCKLNILDSEGGHVEGNESGLYEKNTEISLIAVPDDGYHFVCWSDNVKTLSRSFYIDTNTELYAMFEPNIYTLKYVLDDIEYKKFDMKYGAEIVPEPAPEKEGYSFSGWKNVPKTMPSHDLIIEGKFIINKYKIKWVIDDVVLSETELEYGAVIIEPDAPYKDGYEFCGWNDVPETMPSHDLVIKGTYRLLSSIKNVVDVSKSDSMYSINGYIVDRKENEFLLQRGIYILNGKKILNVK